MYLTTIALFVILIIFILRYWRESMSDRVDDIILAVKKTLDKSGTISDFRSILGDDKFSATKFVYLMDLQRKGELNRSKVVEVLANTSI